MHHSVPQYSGSYEIVGERRHLLDANNSHVTHVERSARVVYVVKDLLVS